MKDVDGASWQNHVSWVIAHLNSQGASCQLSLDAFDKSLITYLWVSSFGLN